MMPGWMSSMIKRSIQRSTELQTWNYNHKKQNKIVKTSWDVKQENNLSMERENAQFHIKNYNTKHSGEVKRNVKATYNN